MTDPTPSLDLRQLLVEAQDRSSPEESFIVWVTPEMARRIVAADAPVHHNRKPSESHLAYLKSELTKGHGVLGDSAIMVAPNGQILNGSNRLASIIETGIPMRLTVVTNCDPGSQVAMDTNLVRRPSDALKLANVTTFDPGQVAIVARQVYAYNPVTHTFAYTPKASGRDLAELTARDSWIEETARVCNKIRKRGVRIKAGHRMGIYLILSAWPEQGYNFCDVLLDGGLPTNIAARLRNVLVAGDHKAFDERKCAAITIKAYNFWLEDASRVQLGWRVDEEFPIAHDEELFLRAMEKAKKFPTTPTPQEDTDEQS